MIGRKNLHVTAERANFPLGALNVRAGSAANVALFDVPVRAGVSVLAVWMRVVNCDGESDDFAAVQTGTLWVVDVPASHFATPGEVPNGVEVWASGTGADGDPHTWSIGVGDLCVLDGDSGAPVPGTPWTAIKLRETAPTNPVYGDAKIESGALYVWDGSQWVGGGGGGGGIVDDTVTRTSSNAVKSSGIWAAIWGTLTALPTGFTALYDWVVAQLAGKVSKTGDTMTGSLKLKGAWLGFEDADTPADMGGIYVAGDTSTGGTVLRLVQWQNGGRVAAVALSAGNAATKADIPAASTSTPAAPTASGSAGSSTAYSRGDHAHPAETLVVTGTIVPTSQDLSTFTVTNLSHTFAEAATAVASGRGAEMRLAFELSSAVTVIVSAPLLVRADDGGSVATLWFGAIAYTWLPGRSVRYPYLFDAQWYDGGDSFIGISKILVEQGDLAEAVAGKLSTTGETRTVTAEDSGGTETYAFVGTGDVGNANAVARIKELPYVNVGEASETLVGVYAISSRGVQRHTATSGETSATFGFADAPGTGKILDALLDIDNSANTSALGLEFNGLGTTFVLAPPDGEDLAEMTSVDGGKLARFYFTETALVSNNLPVISVQRITLGAVATAITRGS